MERFELPKLTGTPVPTQGASLDVPSDMELDVRIDFGRTYLQREDLRRLAGGAIVPLDKTADEPVDVFVGGWLIARGEILVLDGNLCVRLTKLTTGAETV